MIVEGRLIADKIDEQTVQILKNCRYENKCRLLILSVGQDSRNTAYAKMKSKKGEKLGIGVDIMTADGILELLSLFKSEINKVDYSGIILQLPAGPKKIEDEFILEIGEEYDIDGLVGVYFRDIKKKANNVDKGVYSYALSSISNSNGEFPIFRVSATARAVIEILNYYNIEIYSKKILLIGMGRLVGLPLIYLLSKMGVPSFLAIDEECTDLRKYVSESELIISAVGKAGLIKSDWIQSGSVCIDVGLSQDSNGQLVGDFEDVVDKVSLVSLPTGGVGPVTVSMLFRNLVDNYVYMNKNNN